MAAVEEWVRDKDPGFFSSGLMALEHRSSKLCYERDFMKSLSLENQADIIEAFNSTKIP